MELEEIVWIASVAIGKRLDYETLRYSDYMYGKEDEIDTVWELVTECDEIGRGAWRAQYHMYKQYPI